jgi:hypothetical protein
MMQYLTFFPLLQEIEQEKTKQETRHFCRVITPFAAARVPDNHDPLTEEMNGFPLRTSPISLQVVFEIISAILYIEVKLPVASHGVFCKGFS